MSTHPALVAVSTVEIDDMNELKEDVYLTDRVSSTSSHPFGSMLKIKCDFLQTREPTQKGPIKILLKSSLSNAR